MDAGDAVAPRVAEARREEPGRLVRRRRELDVGRWLLVEDAARVRGRGDIIIFYFISENALDTDS